MRDAELPPPPEQGVADIVAGTTRGIVGAVPCVGSLVAEALEFLWSPLRKRQEDWFLRLWLAVRELQARDVLPVDETLAANQAFVSAVAHAGRLAARTHQEEKREALRNAVLNVAAGSALGDDIQAMFLDAVDSLTPSHVRFLSVLGKALVTPEAQSVVDAVVAKSRENGRLAAVNGAPSFAREWMPVNTTRGDLLLFVDPFSEPPNVLHPMWPPVITDILGWLLLQILKDLAGRGFVAVHPPADQFTQVTSTRAFAGVTDQGREFLNFITSPLEECPATS